MLAFLTLRTRCILGQCSENVLCHSPVPQEVLLFFLRNNARFFFAFHSPHCFFLQKKKNIFPQEPRMNFFLLLRIFRQRLLFLLRRLLSYCLCLSVFLFLKTLLCITRTLFLSFVRMVFHLSQNSDLIPSFAPAFFSRGAILEALLSSRNSY